MRKASEHFSEEDHERIRKSVVEAEAKTSCEIVPVVATESGRYDRAEDIIGFWVAVIAAVAVWLLFPREAPDSGSWAGLSAFSGVVFLIAAIGLGFLAGAVAGSRTAWLRRLFTPRRQMREEVHSRAREIFFDQRVHHTQGATGLLIYVSLFERLAVVLGDEEVVKTLGQAALDGLCQQLTSDLRKGEFATAFRNLISEAGDQLSRALPGSTGDVNELKDALVVID